MASPLELEAEAVDCLAFTESLRRVRGSYSDLLEHVNLARDPIKVVKLECKDLKGRRAWIEFDAGAWDMDETVEVYVNDPDEVEADKRLAVLEQETELLALRGFWYPVKRCYGPVRLVLAVAFLILVLTVTLIGITEDAFDIQILPKVAAQDRTAPSEIEISDRQLVVGTGILVVAACTVWAVAFYYPVGVFHWGGAIGWYEHVKTRRNALFALSWFGIVIEAVAAIASRLAGL